MLTTPQKRVFVTMRRQQGVLYELDKEKITSRSPARLLVAVLKSMTRRCTDPTNQTELNRFKRVT
jgi:hypothetical protein